jgi:hypothetical protein
MVVLVGQRIAPASVNNAASTGPPTAPLPMESSVPLS